MTYELTNEHRLRQRALAVPGAYYDRERKAYCVSSPTARGAAAAVALFPTILNSYPELITLREKAYGDSVRPTDHTRPGDSLSVELGDDGSVELYDWQDRDCAYLRDTLAAHGAANILWDRGMGKTVAAAALIRGTDSRRVLVVCRNDAKDPVWKAQLETLLPDHDLIVLRNSRAKRDRDIAAAATANAKPMVFIVHYESLAIIAGDRGKGKGWDRLGEWDLMVFDEGHRLASMNPNAHGRNTQMGYATMKARRKSKMAVNLTGTTIMNHAEDLFGQLHYLLPDVYKFKRKNFADRFLDYVRVGGNFGNRVCIGFRADTLPQLREELGVFSVYRRKEDHLTLPPANPQRIVLDLLPAQQRAYEQLRDEYWTTVEGGGAIIASSAITRLTQLRQIATWVEGLPSAKLDFAMSELEEEPDEQFVVFTWFKAPGRALAERLGDECVVVDGDVASADRTLALERHKRGDVRVLVGSIATLGESLNLQYCHEAIRLDRHWNPGVNAQTFDRLYRNGQNRTVTFRDLVAKGTVDELLVQPRITSKESLRRALFP